MSVGLLKVKSSDVQVNVTDFVALLPKQSSTLTDNDIWKELKSAALNILGQGHSMSPVIVLKTKSVGLILVIVVNFS